MDNAANPLTWDVWKTLLANAMRRQAFPLGSNYDPDSFKEFFESGLGPLEAIEGRLKAGSPPLPRPPISTTTSLPAITPAWSRRDITGNRVSWPSCAKSGQRLRTKAIKRRLTSYRRRYSTRAIVLSSKTSTFTTSDGV